MNRIDVSVIQPNPSKMLSTEHEDDNLTKNPDLYQQHQDSMKSPNSFLLGQGSNSRKFTIFKQLQGMKTTKSEQSLNSNKAKIKFIVPAIEDYYIKQCRENIHPNKIHRMESMIYNHAKKEERPSQDSQIPTQTTSHLPVKQRTQRNLLIVAIVLVLIALLFQKGEGVGWVESGKFGKFF